MTAQNPSIFSFEVERIGTTGIKCTVGCSIANQVNGSLNSATLTVYYKETTSANWTASITTQTITPSDSSDPFYTYATLNLAEIFVESTSYDFYCSIVDNVGRDNSSTETLVGGAPSLLMRTDGISIFGDIMLHDQADTETANITAAKMANLLGLEVRFETRTVYTLANNSSEFSVTWVGSMPSANYFIGITRKGNPDGFDKVVYTVMNQTTTGFTLKSWNNYSLPVEQDLLILAVAI